jgi:hypothetical protein
MYGRGLFETINSKTRRIVGVGLLLATAGVTFSECGSSPYDQLATIQNCNGTQTDISPSFDGEKPYISKDNPLNLERQQITDIQNGLDIGNKDSNGKIETGIGAIVCKLSGDNGPGYRLTDIAEEVIVTLPRK